MKKYMKQIVSWMCALLMTLSMAVPALAADSNDGVVNPSPSTGTAVALKENKEIYITGVKIYPSKVISNGKVELYIIYNEEAKLEEKGSDYVTDAIITLKNSDGNIVEISIKNEYGKQVYDKYHFYRNGNVNLSSLGLTEGTYDVVSAKLIFKDGTCSYKIADEFTDKEHVNERKLEVVSNIESVAGSTPIYKDESNATVNASDVAVKLNLMNDDTYNSVIKNSGFTINDSDKTNCFDISLKNKNTGFPVKLEGGKVKVRVPKYNNSNYTPSKYNVTVYHIITNADGSQKAVVVPSVWPENVGYIEITADSFSPYVVVYKAKTGTITNPVNPVQPVNPANPANPADPDDDDDDDNTSTVVASQNNSNNTTGSSNSTSAAGTTDATNKAPKTGDKTPLAALLFVMTCGGAICAVSVKKMLAR